MDIFENYNADESLKVDDITVKIIRFGRKSVTHIIGWKLPIETLEEYTKFFKKVNGCNGTIKKVSEDYEIQFQGDQIEKVINFLLSKGINMENIKIIGV